MQMPKSSKKAVSVTRPFKWMKRGRVSKPHPRSYVFKYLKLFRLIIQMSKTSRKAEVDFVAPLSKWMKRDGVSETHLLSFVSKHLKLFRLISQILKSSKKGSASEVGLLSPPAVVGHYTKSMKEGKKRVKEEIVEKHVASSKKQNMVDDTGDGGATLLAIDKNKFHTKNQKQKKSVKKPKIREEEQKPKPSFKKRSTKKRVGSSSDESESSDDTGSSSDDEEEKPKKAVAAPTKNRSYEGVKNGYVAVAPAKNEVKISDDDSSFAEESDSDEEPQTLATPEAFRSNYMFMDNLSHSIEEQDVLDFFKDTGKVVLVSLIKLTKRCCGHVRFDTAETAQKALKHNGEELFGQAVKLELIEERCDPGVKPPSKWYTYLFMGNLSPSIQKEDVLDFFKDAGKIQSVHFDYKYGRLSGSGHVNFSSTEAAQKGLKRNKEMLLGQAVELVLATHASVWYSVTPSCTNRRKRRPLGIYIGRGYGSTKKRVGSSSDESESSDDTGSSSDDEEEKPKKAVAAPTKNRSYEGVKNGYVAVAPAKNEVKISDGDSSFAEESDSDEEPQTLATPEAFRSNYMFMDNLSHSIEEQDVLDFFKDTGKVVSVSLIKLTKRCCGHVRFDTAETAQKALKHNGEELFGQAVKLELIEERCDPGVKPPSKWYTYLFMGNLSPSIQKEDVLDFFKDAGKIQSVHFDYKYGRLSGSGHVNFFSTEAAQKGLKRNKEMLLGQAVELVLATHASVLYSVTPSCTNRRKRGPLSMYIGRGYGPTL